MSVVPEVDSPVGRPTAIRTIDVPIEGMDCANCARHVREAIEHVEGVHSVDVLLAAERAVVEVGKGVELDPASIRSAVEAAGYKVGRDFDASDPAARQAEAGANIGKRLALVFGLILGVVVLVAVVGEWLGFTSGINDSMPIWVGVLLAAFIGYPIIWKVVRAAFRGQIVAHALMVVGALAALLVGEWVTAVIVLFFTRVGDYVENLTADQARLSVRRLHEMAPDRATILKNGIEQTVDAIRVRVDDLVLVRPGDRIPVDGVVEEGLATVDHSAVTGESMPVEASPGTRVFGAGIVSGGALRVRASGSLSESTFGRAIRLVEEAEANRGPVQRMADRFSAWYLPVVGGIALLTYLIGGSLMAAIAVMVVACACAFALATPVALLASIGALARRGVLVKGGSYVETLAKVDVVLVDKTGTLTLGRPEVIGVQGVGNVDPRAVLELAAAAERYSEHPIARAIVAHAREEGVRLGEPDHFQAVPGMGVEAWIDGVAVRVGRRGWSSFSDEEAGARRGTGWTRVYVSRDGRIVGYLTAADEVRPEVPEALKELRQKYVPDILLLTGDAADVAAALADRLGVEYRAELLPEDKIEVVRKLQSEGKRVVMIGDGVNDAPALAQADVGIAMGGARTSVAIDAAHVVLMREDWTLVPHLFSEAHRTMGVVRLNIGFTAIYNLVGISLAAIGILAPVAAAALQAVPDLGIMANSARLLRGRR